MIVPSKHDHPDLTVLAVAALLLKKLRHVRVEKFEILRQRLRKYDDQAEPLFVPSMLFLHGMGLVEYHIKTDSFVYQGQK